MAVKGLNPDFEHVDYPTKCIRRPFEEYDAQGNLIGYSWHYGDTVDLQFTIMGEITVASTSLIYKVHGLKPSQYTAGVINQKCYNIDDLISWTCTAIYPGTQHRYTYQWTQDIEFTYPEDGDKDIYITADDFLKKKVIQVQILTLKRQVVDSRLFEGSSVIEYIIDDCLSKKLVQGTYTVNVKVIDNQEMTSVELLKDRDCVLIVRA